MRFVFSAICITMKKSVSVILCAALCLALTAAIFSASMPAAKHKAVKIAVVNRDDSAMMLPLITSMLESRLGGLLKAEILDAEQPTEQYSAVLVLLPMPMKPYGHCFQLRHKVLHRIDLLAFVL